MRSISSSARNFLLIATVVFFVVAGGGAAAWLLLLDKGSEYHEKLQLAANVSEREQSVQELFTLIDDTQAERTELESYFLDVVQIAQLLEQIEQYANNNDLILSSQQLQQITTTDNSDIAQVRIPYEVEGSRSQVLAFVELLEALPYHGFMERLDIRTSDNNPAQVSADVVIVVSYRQYD